MGRRGDGTVHIQQACQVNQVKGPLYFTVQPSIVLYTVGKYSGGTCLAEFFVLCWWTASKPGGVWLVQ